MNVDELVAIIITELNRQANAARWETHVYDDSSVDRVGLDGEFSIRNLAEEIIARMP